MSDRNQQTVLSIDNDAKVTNSIKRALKSLGVKVLATNSGDKALGFMEQASIDVVITELQLPDISAVEFLRKARELQPQTQRILLTDSAELETLVSAINEGGIAGFISKPCANDQLVNLVSEALQLANMYRENVWLLEESKEENAQLNEHIADLEKQVAECSAEVDVAHAALQKSMDELKSNYEAMVDLSANLAAMPGAESMSTGKKIALAMAMGKNSISKSMN